MNKYLIEILKIQSSIILPGLGALMVPSQKSGTIVFNQHLKFNDGSFARYIAEKEGINEQDAQNKVAKFVREIEAELGKGNSYDMFEFGKFFKTKDGNIDFKMFSDKGENEALAEEKEVPVEKKKTPAMRPAAILAEQASDSNTELDKANDKKLAEEKKALEKEAKEKQKAAKRAAEEEALRQEKEAENKALEEAQRKREEEAAALKKAEEEKIVANLAAAKIQESKKTIEEVKEEVKEIKPIIDAETSSNAEKINLDKHSKNTFTPASDAEGSKKEVVIEDKTPLADAAPSTEETTMAPPPADKVEEKKKRSKLPWLILLLLLIGLGVAGFFYKDQILAYFDKGDHNTDQDSTEIQHHSEEIDAIATEIDTAEIEVIDEPIEEMIDEVVEDVVEEPLPVVTTGTNNGTYHLIGNSFGEEANANRYLETMKGKGYPAKIIGRYDGLYLVSLKSYDSRQAAELGKSSVAADASSAWVFNKP